MRVRGAGGLLVGVVLYPIAQMFEGATMGNGLVDAFEQVMWHPEAGRLPANTQLFLVARALLIVGGLGVGVLGVAGARASRFPIAVAAAGIALGALPWAIWDFDQGSFDDYPPDWVFENPLWFFSGRLTALLWITVCTAVFVLAVTDRAPSPATPTFGAPPLGPAGPPWPAPAGPQPFPQAPNPAPPPPSAGPTPGPPPQDSPGPGPGTPRPF